MIYIIIFGMIKKRKGDKMNIQRRNLDLDKVFDQKWKANNYNQNGMKAQIDANKKMFNKMYNIKTDEEKKAEILEANSVNGRVARLEENMRAVATNFNRNNF